MKLILNGNSEFEVSRNPKLSGDTIQITLEDVSGLPEVIMGEVILQDMVVWPTQETVGVEPQPEVFVLWRTTAEEWLRYYIENNTLCFTKIPAPAQAAPYVPTEEEIRLEIESNVRKERDSLLAETDWTQVLDAPVAAECRDAFRVYRQALRDVPQQEGFPYTVKWPGMPDVVKAIPDHVDTALEILVGGNE